MKTKGWIPNNFYINFCNFLIVSTLVSSCQASSQSRPLQAERLTQLGLCPLEIQISVLDQAIWSLIIPSHWQKQEKCSHQLGSSWKLLAVWSPQEDTPTHSLYEASLWTRAPFAGLALDAEMELIEKNLGAHNKPTFSHGITQNGLMGIEAARVEEPWNWKWALLTPDPTLARQAPLKAMQQPLLLLITYKNSEVLYEEEPVFETVYQSLKTIRTFSL